MAGLPAAASVAISGVCNTLDTEESHDHGREAIFTAGCFWSIEDTFRKMPGVKDAISGYTGGSTPNPTYQQVCTGGTYAEAVRVVFDDDKVDYRTLLNAFFEMHDPTQVNRQGPDIGPSTSPGSFSRMTASALRLKRRFRIRRRSGQHRHRGYRSL